jgi:serine phosphatase RsbU (regulator of sigma subunit)/tetratricopeptide (TPR) repeat protein
MRLQLLIISFVFIFCFLINSLTSFSQTKENSDSLLQILKKTKYDTTRVNLYNKLYISYFNSDTVKAIEYYNKALQLAHNIKYNIGIADAYTNYSRLCETNKNYKRFISYNNKAIQIYKKAINSLDTPDSAIKIIYITKIAKVYQNLGNSFNNREKFDEALGYFKMSIDYYKKTKNTKNLRAVIYSVGNIYKFRSEYEKALDYYLQHLKLSEEVKDKKSISIAYIGIGNVYINWDNLEKALEAYQLSEKNALESSSFHNVAMSQVGQANVYLRQGKNDKALDLYNKCLVIEKQIDNKEGIALALLNMGDVYIKQEETLKAIKYYKEALSIVEEIDNKVRINLILYQIGFCYLQENQYQKAIEYFNKSIQVAKEVDYNQTILADYQSLSQAYVNLNEYKKAYHYQLEYFSLKDTLFNREKYQQVTEIQTKYETEKKQKEIELLEKDKALQNTEIEKQITQKYAFISGFALMLILAIVALLSYRKIKAQKFLIEEKNEKLNQQNEKIAAQRDSLELFNVELGQKNEEITTQRDEIEAQRDEIEAQRDLVTVQKEQLEEIHRELTDSIHYAERIQKVVLPASEYIYSIIPEHFVLYKPRDIVSGDFYWTLKKKSFVYIAVADCTGHGVPGAIMSMLGVSFLNEITNQNNYYQADQILNTLREYIIKALQQKGVTGEQKDGMDISFVILDTTTNMLQFSGANNPLYIVKNQKQKVESEALLTLDFQLYELKPDKMPVAIYENMKPFTNQMIQVNKGDILYLASDGYEDQFGGPKGKKLLSKNFKQLIIDNAHCSMVEQREILDKTIENWKKGYQETFEQTDDITVMGIKI